MDNLDSYNPEDTHTVPEPRITFTVPQGEFVTAYLDETSPSFLNTSLAATQANLPITEARSLTKRNWVKELAEEHPMLIQAENNLSAILDLPVDDYEHADRVAKVSMFVAERLGKHKYSTRQELTAEGGKPLVPQEEVEMRIINLRKKSLE